MKPRVGVQNESISTQTKDVVIYLDLQQHFYRGFYCMGLSIFKKIQLFFTKTVLFLHIFLFALSLVLLLICLVEALTASLILTYFTDVCSLLMALFQNYIRFIYFIHISRRWKTHRLPLFFHAPELNFSHSRYQKQQRRWFLDTYAWIPNALVLVCDKNV